MSVNVVPERVASGQEARAKSAAAETLVDGEGMRNPASHCFFFIGSVDEPAAAPLDRARAARQTDDR